MADIDLCPRCQAPLKFNGAKSCECGWKKRERAEAKSNERPRVPVDCCYEACRHDAVLKILTKTGWANMCALHHDAYHLAVSKQYTSALGMKTREELTNYCRQHRDQLGRGKMHGAFKAQFEANKPNRLRQRERVPGEDDEELEAADA